MKQISVCFIHRTYKATVKGVLGNILPVPISNIGKGKVKCTLVQALRFCTGRTAHRGSRGIALLFLDHGNRGW